MPNIAKRDIGIAVALTVACLTVYGQTAGFPFVNYDDPVHVYGNPAVRGGLSPDGLRWAITATGDAGWIPMTWLSRMLDASLFGMNAGAHHFVNLLLHIVNTLLLYRFLRRVTGRTWACAVIAALFAVHPLHVESVAWVTERKDVLAACFWFLSLDAYVSYCARPSAPRSFVVASFFLLGLMSKPIVVTLPFVLLLLDYWPLGRVRAARLLVEKLPLFILSALFCVLTLIGQEKADALASLDLVPMGARISNGLSSYVAYLAKTLVPYGLSVHYPHPGTAPAQWKSVSAGGILVAMTAFSLVQLRRRPWIPVGWFWFVGTLLPVIGLVQAGRQAMADRCTYIPLTGIFLILIWGGTELSRRMKQPSVATMTVAVVWLAGLSAVAWVQVGYWRSSPALFAHALQVTDGNWLAHNQLGHALEREGKVEEAIRHYRAALRILPDYAEAHDNLGVALLSIGKSEEAESHFREAIRLAPSFADGWNNLGVILARAGRRREAIDCFREALRRRTAFPGARYNLGSALVESGDVRGAIIEFRASLAEDPTRAECFNALGIALAMEGRRAEAVDRFREALRLRPGYPEARANLEKAEIQP